MVNGLSHIATKINTFLAKVVQNVAKIPGIRHILSKFKRNTPAPYIFVINSDALNIQQGPVTLERAGRDNDTLSYIYMSTYTMGIAPKDSVVIKGIDLT